MERKVVFRAGVGGRHVHELSIDDEDNLYGPDVSYEARTEKYLIGSLEDDAGRQRNLASTADRHCHVRCEYLAGSRRQHVLDRPEQSHERHEHCFCGARQVA